MKARATFTSRLAAGLCGLGALAGAAVGAQQGPAYQDRTIEGGTLAPDISKGEADASDSGGLARSLQIDGVVSALHSGSSGSGTNTVEDGVLVKSQWETVHYGVWSLDAAGRTGGSGLSTSAQGQGFIATLRQRGMPFDGGWMADNALGDIITPEVALARSQQRFYLPTGAVQGVSTDWRGPSGLQVVAGGGRPGIYDGIEVPDFQTRSGDTASLGVQWAPVEHWAVGGQWVDARDANLAIGPVIDGGARQSSSTELLSAAWADRGARLQANLIEGAVGGKGNAGSWIDGSLVQGHWQQNAGLFRIDPNLTWGNQLISNDMQGGYYRLGYQARRWLADVGLDEVHSLSGLGSNTTFVTGDARYQLSRDWGAGGVTNISRTDGGVGWSLESYVDRATRWGTGRAEVSIAETPTGRDSAMTLDQTWATPDSLRLSTSASIERIRKGILDGARQDSTVLSLAAFGGGQFTNRLSIEGNVRWARALQGHAAPGVSANISMSCQVSPSWQILATYYDSRSGSWTSLTVTSPLSPPIATAVPAVQERGAFLTMRYRRASGLHFAPLGGPVGGASGELAGTLYLDANDNARFDAGELGAPNVTVVLDGRFSVQSDANGRFDFPAVAAGHHVISVVSDNLPLPWTLAGEGRLEVVVTTRDRTDLAIAAHRPR
ncbi:MAG: hypothetical protein M3N97_11745 [Pseudomonadota bacterium]|nr:hypothetical protein [Pseudomonadota bacterium]